MLRNSGEFVFAILLALALAQASRAQGTVPTPHATGKVTPGTWGGTHVQMIVTADGAALEFDCAKGTISEPLALDASSRFQVKGTFQPQHGGPIKKGESSPTFDTVYSGVIEGDTLQLEFKDSQGSLQKFTLTRGQPGKLRRCL